MIVVVFRHTRLSRNGPVAYAGEKKGAGGPTEAQKWKIKKLCAVVGRDFEPLFSGIRTVKEASGIIDQLQAEEKEKAAKK